MTADTKTFDVVVVGSGAAGMVAALTATGLGLETVVLEKAAVFGGSTAISGGSAWVPNAPAIRRKGGPDDSDEALAYLTAIAGDCVSPQRLARFVEAGPKMFEFVEQQSPYLRDAFRWAENYPDYHPALGGSSAGHTITPAPIDRRALGPDEKTLRTGWARMQGLPRGMWLTGADLHSIVRIRWKSGRLNAYRTLARLCWRTVRSRVLKERMSANGGALAIRLRLALRDAGVSVMLEAPMTALTVDDEGRVTGVEVGRGDGTVTNVRGRRGVILATGGYEHNSELRARHQPFVQPGWSVASRDNTGDGQRAAEAAGAALELMDEAWWYPAVLLPHGIGGGVAERQYPGHFIVNGDGRRFVNEAAPYTDFGHALIAGHASGIRHIPSWMILDDHAWKHNIVCGHFPGRAMAKDWLKSGLVKRADTLEELATAIDVPPENLRETAARFNAFARRGRDEDFGRGDNRYDNYYGDPSLPNPNLAEVNAPPFFAFQIVLSDLGTKGGVATDTSARVLRADGSVIPGLYAAGNVAAPVMGRSYAGAGATIGPAMTFAWLAACDLAGVSAEDAIAGRPKAAHGV